MAGYPVHYIVEKPLRYSRVQLVARVLTFIVLGMLGVTLASLFAIAWFTLPLVAAVRLAGREPDEYLTVDGPRLIRGLQWFAAIYAWFGLVTDRLPARAPEETVLVVVETSGRPASSSGLLRLLLGLPSALVLGLIGLVMPLVWLWAALGVLFNGRVGDGSFAFLAGFQRWAVRLLAYQASLVEDYPPFSFADDAQLPIESGQPPAEPLPAAR